jgi:hypothetical protein
MTNIPVTPVIAAIVICPGVIRRPLCRFRPLDAVPCFPRTCRYRVSTACGAIGIASAGEDGHGRIQAEGPPVEAIERGPARSAKLAVGPRTAIRVISMHPETCHNPSDNPSKEVDQPARDGSRGAKRDQKLGGTFPAEITTETPRRSRPVPTDARLSDATSPQKRAAGAASCPSRPSAIYVIGPEPATMAATNKCLAQNSKPRTGANCYLEAKFFALGPVPFINTVTVDIDAKVVTSTRIVSDSAPITKYGDEHLYFSSDDAKFRHRHAGIMNRYTGRIELRVYGIEEWTKRGHLGQTASSFIGFCKPAPQRMF